MKSIITRIRQSLSLKLSVSIVLLAVPIFAITLGFLFQQSRSNIRQESIDRATSTLSTTTMRMMRYLNTVEDATNTCAWLVAEHFEPDSLLAYSHFIVMLNADVDGCSIMAEPNAFPQYGRYFSACSVRERPGASVTTVRETEYDYLDKPWYKTPLVQGKACWVDPYGDYAGAAHPAKGLIASYCRPLHADDGRLLGVIATDLSLEKLSAAINAQKPYPHAYYLMLGQDGHYFVHPDSTRLVDKTIFSMASAADHPEIIALGHEMTSGQQGYMSVTIGGEPCLVCYQSVPGTRWSLALVCPSSDIFSSYNRLSLIMLPFVVLGLILILLLSHHIVAHAVRPLNQLVWQSQLIAQGHYGGKIARSRRADAVGRLQNSFATMQESIERRTGDISRMNDVAAERNRELKQARLMALEANRQKMTFIQNMTHQIRTPLNIITGFAHILSDSRTALPAGELDSITTILTHNAKMLRRMVLMLYDSSESGLSEELSSQREDRVGCVDIALQSIEATREHFPDIKVDFLATVPQELTISTNPLYLMRSLREILYNSAKYSDGQHISMRVEQTGTVVRFVIQDVGPGIAAENHDQMFEPFTKVNDLSEGLGLGLPLAKRHAANLGGDLRLDASYHDGCRFVLELPFSPSL